MGMVGPEGMSQAKEINAVRCLTRQAVRLRHKGLRGKCLTFQTPLALLNQSLFDKTADGFRAVLGEIVFSGPSVDPGQRGGCEPEGNELVTRRRSPASFLYNTCCIGHGLVYNNINAQEQPT